MPGAGPYNCSQIPPNRVRGDRLSILPGLPTLRNPNPDKGTYANEPDGKGKWPCISWKLKPVILSSRTQILSVLLTGHGEVPSKSGREGAPGEIRERARDYLLRNTQKGPG